MRRFLLAPTVGLALALASAATRAEPPPAGPSVVELDVKKGALAAQLKTELALAKKRKLRPFIEVGATWCGPCQALTRSLGHPLMIDALRGVHLIRVDLDQFDADLKKAGFKVTGVPVFFALDDAGRPTGRRIDGSAWGADTPENMAPPLKSFFAAGAQGSAR
jgi:thiol-disulfide isomerase/thioredoxin